MKILFLDLETSPNLAHVWGLWQQNVAIRVAGAPTTQVRNAADILTQKTESETIDMPF